MRRTIFLLCFIFVLTVNAFCAPSYGTRMPEKRKFFASFESYSIFRRYLENNNGKLRSQQQFYGMSYGVTDWFSIDAKAGAGNIKQHPVGSDEIDYHTSFAGGYGMRLRLLEKENWKIVFGFHHISVHPKSAHLGIEKHQSILDDYQNSLVASYQFKRFTPYLGTRWSKVDYIHRELGEKERIHSDGTKLWGFIYGFDIPIGEKFWVNVEGQAVDSEALAVSFNYSF